MPGGGPVQRYSSTVPLSPTLIRLWVTLDLTHCSTVAAVPPGLVQYSAESESTRSRTTSGVSGPSGNHASTAWFQSSRIFARSRTTSAVPATDTHSVRLPKDTLTRGSAAMWATWEVPSPVKNHMSPSSFTSWTASGRLTSAPASLMVVNIPMWEWLMMSVTLLMFSVSGMLSPRSVSAFSSVHSVRSGIFPSDQRIGKRAYFLPRRRAARPLQAPRQHLAFEELGPDPGHHQHDHHAQQDHAQAQD